MVYMLNLLFNPSNTDGLFVDYSNAGAPLTRSKTWLTCPDPTNWNSFNVLTASWTDTGVDATVSISKSATPYPICVRIASASGLTSPTIRLSVLFGRKRGNQRFASPFTLNNAASGTSCAVFDTNYDAPQLSDGSWFWPLRPLSIAPGNSGLVYRFDFLVGATVVVGGVATTFGHDPEMDVQM
jgi:hypothetical protein